MSEEEQSPLLSGEKKEGTFTKKAGPLPVWAWGAIALGVVVLLFIILAATGVFSGGNANNANNANWGLAAPTPTPEPAPVTMNAVITPAPNAPAPAPALPPVPVLTDYLTSFTHAPEWFSGTQQKKTLPIGTVSANATLTSITLQGESKDQGWGNPCGRVGIEIMRAGTSIHAGTVTAPRGWAPVARTYAVDNLELQPGDVVNAYVQGLYPGCSAYSRNFTWSLSTTSTSPTNPI
jgi:hypothetical protein